MLLLPHPLPGRTPVLTVLRSKPPRQPGPREAKANTLPLQEPSPPPSHQAFLLRPAIVPLLTCLHAWQAKSLGSTAN